MIQIYPLDVALAIPPRISLRRSRPTSSNSSSILHVADGVAVLTMVCLVEQGGATITMGTWPRALKVFKQNLEAGKFDESMKLSGGRKMKIRGM